MARTSSRVRDLARSGGYGVPAGHVCQWLLLIALAKSASRTRRSNEFQREQRSTYDEASANTFSTWGRPDLQ